MSHEEEDLDSMNQYKFKHLACNEKRNSIRGGFLATRPIWSTLKMLVSILTLCLIVVVLTKLRLPKDSSSSVEAVNAGLNNQKIQTIIETPLEPYYHYIPSSISEPLEGHFYIIMPTGTKYALTNEAGLITLTSYTFERNQLFRFSLNGRTGSPKKFSIFDKSDNYFLGLGGNETKLMGFEKVGAGEDAYQWSIRDQTHREGSFQIIPSTSDSCLAFDNQENSVIMEDCAPFRSTQYWLLLPICDEELAVS